ncbi:MAG: hypothetical protein GYA61_00465 [Spirochaetales bacterium]|jgi:hypothetical protein|nr:hypothetical protein [Exilispira sp.]NMC66676.1 hypothetical protein [Spirochaetales bacterium]
MSRFVILKGRTRSENMNFYGVFIIVIDSELKIMEKCDVIVSRIPTFYNSSISRSWQEVYKEILQLSFEGKNNVTYSKSIVAGIEKLFMNEDVSYLVDLISNDFEKFQTLLLENINRTFGNGDCKAEIIKYFEDSLEMQAQSTITINPESLLQTAEETVDFDIPPGVNLIPIKPALAPVSGKPIYEIVPQDLIYVYIDPSFDRYKDYINYFNALVDDKLVPIKGEVLEVRIDLNNNYILLIKLDENTYGKLIEEEKVKVKMYTEQVMTFDAAKIQAKSETTKKQKKASKAQTSLIYILLGIVGFLFIVFILSLFL